MSADAKGDPAARGPSPDRASGASPLRPGEIGFGLALLAFAGVALWRSTAISGVGNITGAGVFPMLASAVMVASALAVLADAMQRRSGGSGSVRAVARYLVSARLLVFLVLMAFYAAAIPLAGFVAASAAFVFVSVAFLWRRGVVWSALVAAVSVGALYLLFRIVFQVVLPTGSLWRGSLS